MKYFALILLCLIGMPVVNAAQKVHWGTDHWQGFTAYDGTGFYHELMERVFSQPDYMLDVDYYPWKRLLKHLSNGDIDMTGAMPKNTSFYQSKKPLLEEDILIISKAEDDIDAFNLNGKLGAFRAGYDDAIFYAVLPDTAKGVEVKDIEHGRALLAQGKVDFYVDIESLVYPTFENELKRGELTVSDIGELRLFWSFAHNQDGQRLKQHFDQAIHQMTKQGSLAALYKKYDLTMPN